jgi:uncharacterized protein with FMN-binding domain
VDYEAPTRPPERRGGRLLLALAFWLTLAGSVELWWLDTPARSLTSTGDILTAASLANPSGSAPSAAPRTTAPAGGGTGLQNGAFSGSAEEERGGTITVTIALSGARITDAFATCVGCNSASQSISDNAFIRLRQETLQAHSANIATVAGATYTSGAYKTSLQAAVYFAHV